ncbi:MAG: 50S ribosomal protein L18Ae [Thermoplasmatota archaeon]
MRAFRVAGRFKMGRRVQPFSMEVASDEREGVEERVLKELGSRHRTKRRDIRIERVEELSPESVSSLAVKMMLEGR